MKGYKMGFVLGLVALWLLVFGVHAALTAPELIDEQSIYQYIPPEPRWKEVETPEEYARYTEQTRVRKVAELHGILWKTEEAMDKAKYKSKEKAKLKELFNQALGDVLDYNSPVLPYTPYIESFENFQKAYKVARDKTKFTTKSQIKEWTLADGNETKFKAVIGAVTPKRVVFLSPNDKKIVVAYSRLCKEDRATLRAELLEQQKRTASIYIENKAKQPSFKPYPKWKVPVER